MFLILIIVGLKYTILYININIFIYFPILLCLNPIGIRWQYFMLYFLHRTMNKAPLSLWDTYMHTYVYPTGIDTNLIAHLLHVEHVSLSYRRERHRDRLCYPLLFGTTLSCFFVTNSGSNFRLKAKTNHTNY